MKKTIVTIIALAGIVHADFVWNGGDTISSPKWSNQDNWTLTNGTTWTVGNESGPGMTGSDKWEPIVVSNASGSIRNFEGWALNLTLINSQMIVNELVKFQNNTGKGCTLNIDKDSSLIIDKYSGAGNDGESVNVNCDGVLTISYAHNQGGAGISAVLGTSGMIILNKHRTNLSEGYTAKVLTLEADLLADATLGMGEIGTRTLIELSKYTSMNELSANNITINAAEGWTRINSAEEATDPGQYYWVSQSEEGIKLNYVTIPEPTTATLSLLALAGLAARRRRR